MDALLFALILLALWLPLHLPVIAHLRSMESGEHFRRHGVVVKRKEALDLAGETIGTYLGAPIFDRVEFLSMVYEFAGVMAAGEKRRIGENQLYLEPGLLYVRVA